MPRTDHPPHNPGGRCRGIAPIGASRAPNSRRSGSAPLALVRCSSRVCLTSGQTRSVSSKCYACEQSGPHAPFRERFVRESGWRVAHDFNSSLEGWLILAPLRHVHSLDELATDETFALGDLLRKASVALKSVTGCEKTYVMLFAEAEGFAHLHVHVVPRMPDQPDDRRGPDVFGYLKDGHPLPPERRDEVAEALLAAWPG